MHYEKQVISSKKPSTSSHAMSWFFETGALHLMFV
jgi:hypothetical protein